jgi:dTDP-4-amino-4,6-dideoxygalactose transaminase
MRTDHLPFHLPFIGDEEIAAVTRVLRSGWLTTGAETRRFEEAFAAFVGAPYAVAVNSCTAALLLALEAAGVGPGDEVIVPTMTFAATGNVVIHLGAVPVVVDCHRTTLTVDPGAVAAAITDRTKAMIPVHFAGHPCDMTALHAIASPRGIAVIEDAAHALPARYDARMIGSISDATCFSFYATKTITTGEGGMLTTARADYAERARMMSLHGISKDAWKRYAVDGSWRYDVVAPGFKCNMTDIAAAIGEIQLRRCMDLWDARCRIASRYLAGLQDLDGLSLPHCSPGVQHAWHLFVVQVDSARAPLHRDALVERLRKQRIGTSVHFIPLHTHPYYTERFRYSPAQFPNATQAFTRILSLPIFPGMTDGDVDDVIGAIRGALRRN